METNVCADDAESGRWMFSADYRGPAAVASFFNMISVC